MNIVRTISRNVFYSRRYRQCLAYFWLVTCAVLAAVFASPQLAAATTTTVRMVVGAGTTTFGTVDIQLDDDQAPKTVANFLHYAGRGDYTNVIIHRSVPGFVIQGGGYKCCNVLNQSYHIPTDPPVPNEFDPSRSNIPGTIAMALVGSDINSATSEWFFNLVDNSASLDPQKFTVFGQVLDNGPGTGMAVVDAIAALPIENFGAPFDALPLFNFNTSLGLQLSNFVMVTNIPNVKSTPTIQGTGSLLMTFTADVDLTFTTAQTFTTTTPITAQSLLTTFTPPPNQSAQFNDGIFRFTITGALGPTGRIVTLHNDDPTTANRYYAYGPTPDNPTPHWYDFSFDGTTGAEFVGNKILLHFVDGQRGDDDLTVNNSITHTGAPVMVAAIPASSSGGCTISPMPSHPTNNGDWVLISIFLTFVALVRRRTRRDRIQRATNIASP